MVTEAKCYKCPFLASCHDNLDIELSPVVMATCTLPEAEPAEPPTIWERLLNRKQLDELCVEIVEAMS